MTFTDFLKQFGPVWAPADDNGGGGDGGDGGQGGDGGDGDNGGGDGGQGGDGGDGDKGGDGGDGDKGGDGGDGDKGGKGAKWFENERFDDKTKKYLNERGLDQSDDPLEALQKTIDAHRNATAQGRNPDEYMAKPTDGQSTPDWLKEHGLLNLPDTADAYEIKRPDMPEGINYNEAGEAQLKEFAFAQGLAPEAVQGLVELQTGLIADQQERLNTEFAKATSEMNADLEKEWGDQLAARTNRAGQAMQVVAEIAGIGHEEIALMAQSMKKGGVNDASTMRVFDTIAEMLGNDMAAGLGKGQSNIGMSPQQAQQKLDQIKSKDGEYGKAYAAKDRGAMKRLQPEIDQLTKLAAAK